MNRIFATAARTTAVAFAAGVVLTVAGPASQGFAATAPAGGSVTAPQEDPGGWSAPETFTTGSLSDPGGW
jgi:hypothetical protein